MQTHTHHYDLHVTITEFAGSKKGLLGTVPLELDKLLHQSCQRNTSAAECFCGFAGEPVYSSVLSCDFRNSAKGMTAVLCCCLQE